MCIYLFIFNGHPEVSGLFAINHSIRYEKFQHDRFMFLKLKLTMVKFNEKQAL